MVKSYTLWLFEKGDNPNAVGNSTTITDARKKAYDIIKYEPMDNEIIILDDNARGSGEMGTVTKKSRFKNGKIVWKPKDRGVYILRPNGTLMYDSPRY